MRFILYFLLFEETVQSCPGQKVKRCSKMLTMNCPLSFNLRSVLNSFWIIPDFFHDNSSTFPAAKADTENWATNDFHEQSRIKSVEKHKNIIFLCVFLNQKFCFAPFKVNIGSHFRFLFCIQPPWTQLRDSNIKSV